MKISKSWTVLRLGLPLLILFAVSVALHSVVDADGFFLNLATELIGIGVTVAYVDRVLRRHDEAQWRETRNLIDGRIRLASNKGLTGIRSALGFGDLGEAVVVRSTDYRKAIREKLVPQLTHSIRELSQEGWRELATALRAAASDADLILRTLGTRLRPGEYSALLNLQDQVRIALLTYDIHPDQYGSDFDPSSPADVVGNEFYTKSAIREVGAVVEQLLQLGDLVSDDE